MKTWIVRLGSDFQSSLFTFMRAFLTYTIFLPATYLNFKTFLY